MLDWVAVVARTSGSRRRVRPHRQARGYLITAIVSPDEIEPPSETFSSSTVPALCAVISFSIFIASITQISAPSSTVAPFSTATLRMLPWSGDASVSPPPPPPPPARSRRLGALRRRAPAPFGRRHRLRRSGADHLDVELAARDLDGVGALDLLLLVVLGGRGRLVERELLEPLLVLDQVAAGLAVRHCFVPSRPMWNGISVLTPPTSISPSAR